MVKEKKVNSLEVHEINQPRFVSQSMILIKGEVKLRTLNDDFSISRY